MSTVHVRITNVLVDWSLNFKTVNSFEDVQYKMCYKDIYSRISKIGKIIKL